MASISEYTSKRGVTTFKVRFRHEGKSKSETFVTKNGAMDFKERADEDIEKALLWLHSDDDDEQIDDTPKAYMTLDQLAERWFELRAKHVAAGTLTPRVLAYYRSYYRIWIQPELGDRDIAAIADTDVQDWVDGMLTAPRSTPKTIIDRYSILSSMMKWAVKRKFIRATPCFMIDLPAKQKPLPRGLSVVEQVALWSAAVEICPEAADLIAGMMGTGFRMSEITAVTKAQIENLNPYPYVTMNRIWRAGLGFVPTAKSDSGLRRLRVLTPQGIDAFRRGIIDKQPGDHVFLDPQGRPWSDNYFRTKYWPQIVKAAGLEERKPTPHWLRHSHVFVCHAAGLTLVEIQRRLGHSKLDVTMGVYGRMIDDMNDEAAANVQKMFGGGDDEGPKAIAS